MADLGNRRRHQNELTVTFLLLKHVDDAPRIPHEFLIKQSIRLIHHLSRKAVSKEGSVQLYH